FNEKPFLTPPSSIHPSTLAPPSIKGSTLCSTHLSLDRVKYQLQFVLFYRLRQASFLEALLLPHVVRTPVSSPPYPQIIHTILRTPPFYIQPCALGTPTSTSAGTARPTLLSAQVHG